MPHTTPEAETPPEVLVTTQDHVATIVIDRPQARNAISLSTMDALHAALDEIESHDIRVLVLRGAGEKAFVSGGDLKELSAIRDEEGAAEMATRMRRFLDRLAAYPVPVIAAINGHALGGGAEVAVAADLRMMSDDASIGFTQTLIGIMPAWGGAERLVELVGPSKAMLLITAAKRLSAQKALEYGLIELVAKREDFDAEVASLSHAIAQMPENASRSIKAVISACRPRTHKHLEQDAVRHFARLWASDDHWRLADEHLRKLKSKKKPG